MNWKAAAALIATVIGASAAAATVKMAGVPARLDVIESRTSSLEKNFDKMDVKLDRILERLPSGRR